LYSSLARYTIAVLGPRNIVQIRVPYTDDQKSWSTWDHAGTALLYRASGGGVMTDVEGRYSNFQGRKLDGYRGVITADKAIHSQVLWLVKQLKENRYEKPHKQKAKAP
jgi:3'-phosphoadenosine 5'-phosphosulfate (PAPS) 3'-phosphatase